MITQNIDGLHRRSGLDSELILELHGTTAEAVCLGCDRRISMDEAVERVGKGELAPRCGHCGGLLKPATVSFGQSLPLEVLDRSQRAARACEVFLAVGLIPGGGACRLPSTPGQTVGSPPHHPQPRPKPRWDSIADLVIRDEIGRTLPLLVEPLN